ncbi:hypothetical protein [Sphingomonas profundi]|uniref:hypothetical protein n=1 Tax=Alterirhizorhabdus profundi TaxID=2681549 RepID=UPI0012E77941|nr:hypothetical protein [Sphingomonas profundi]
MADDTITHQPATPGEMALDPYEFQPGVASKIQGLGGTESGHNPDYAFHTRYIEVAEGVVHFTARFAGLRASYGTLLLRVHRFSQKEGSELVLANMVSVELDRLAHNGGSVSIRFEGFQDVFYAFYGGVIGDTDATARDLTISVSRPVDPSRKRSVAVEARNTSFGNEAMRPAAYLTSMAQANLNPPLSQIATAAQLREPTGVEWVARLGIADRDPCAQWEHAYVAQAISAYGMLQPGAHALALRQASPELLALLAGSGLTVTDTSHAAEERDGEAAAPDGRRADLCDADTFAANVTARPSSFTDLSPELVNFDLLWSTAPAEETEAPAAVAQAIQQVMGCLRPGGLAVHTVAYDPTGADPRCFDRQRFDQLMLGLIAGGHEVAQIRLVREDALACDPAGGAQTRVGVIARRARLAA